VQINALPARKLFELLPIAIARMEPTKLIVNAFPALLPARLAQFRWINVLPVHFSGKIQLIAYAKLASSRTIHPELAMLARANVLLA